MSRPEMGTVFRVALYAPDDQTAQRAADAAFARIAQLNQTLSDYLPDSELSLLSTAGGGEVGPDLYKMLHLSQEIAHKTDGAFDITLGPVIQLWRQARKDKKLPRAGEIEQALRASGYEKLLLTQTLIGRNLVKLTVPNMRLDLGGIAKGFAATEALHAMRRVGVTRALVVGGGDVVAGEAPPGKDGWRVDVRPFGESDASSARTLILHNAAVSTSGDLFQYVEIEGVRYSHIVDPETGLGLTRPMAVTVTAPLRRGGGTTTDAYATALSVLGPEQGLRVIEQIPGAAAIFAIQENGQTRLIESKRVKKLRFE